MTRKRKIILILGVSPLVLLAIVVGAFIWLVKRDLSPEYQAQSAKPIIGAWKQYYRKTGKYPSKPSDLGPFLPAKVHPFDANENKDAGFAIDDGATWFFEVATSNGIPDIWVQMRDEGLSYSFDGTNDNWEFDPGDGTTGPIKLNIKIK